MAVCCQNLTLGALSSGSALSVLVGALFKKFGLFLNTPRVYLRTNKILIHNSLYLFENSGKKLGHKKMKYNYSKTMLTGREKSIRIIGDSDNQRPDK